MRTISLPVWLVFLFMASPAVHAGENPKVQRIVQGKPINQWVTALRRKELPLCVEAIMALREAGPAGRVAVRDLLCIFQEK
jgi:hypothetical protein